MSKIFTKEQELFIFDNYKGRYNQELADMLNKEFDTQYTCKQIKSFKQYRHLNSGITGYFEKGSVPANKGKKMSAEHYAKSQATMFKKGNVPANTLPIGTEVIDSYGYTMVKVNDIPKAKKNVNWKWKHHIAYEKVYGSIPKDHFIIFLDGNKQNFDIDNLACVTKREMIFMQRYGLYFENRELTRSGVYVAKLITKAFELKKGGG